MARPVPLVLAGNRKQPDHAALAAACAVPELMPAWLPVIERALFDHYMPCLDACQRGERDAAEAAVPVLSSLAQVWKHAQLLFIDIAPIDGVMTTELGFGTDWDTEHTLGARFVGSNFIELNGSV